MSVAALLAELQAAGATARAEGDHLRLIARAPLSDDLLTQVRAHKDELLSVLADPVGGLEGAVEGLALTVPELLGELTPEERAEAEAGLLEPELLRAFAEALTARRMRERGERPPTYTRRAACRLCGPVWLPEGLPAEVNNCPWCFNRIAGRPVPRPSRVVCADCQSWTADPIGVGGGVGACSAGGPEPGEPACYPRAPRSCARFTPRPTP